jgi:hypothetical protein
VQHALRQRATDNTPHATCNTQRIVARNTHCCVLHATRIVACCTLYAARAVSRMLRGVCGTLQL